MEPRDFKKPVTKVASGYAARSQLLKKKKTRNKARPVQCLPRLMVSHTIESCSSIDSLCVVSYYAHTTVIISPVVFSFPFVRGTQLVASPVILPATIQP